MGALTFDNYLALRRAGWLVTPLVEGRLPGHDIDIIGIDLFTTPPQPGVPQLSEGEDVRQFLEGTVVFAHPISVADLPEGLPEVRPLLGVAPGAIVADVLTAQTLLQTTTLTALLILPSQPTGLEPLGDLVPHLSVEAPQTGGDLSRLTDSFHLNLTAFGLLAAAVGLFIVHAAIGLAFEQRRALFRTLRALGVPLRGLILALALELGAFALIGGILGVGLGYLVAGALLPGVAATLSGLYGAAVPGGLSLPLAWWGQGLAIAFLGAGLGGGQSLWRLAALPPLAPAKPRAWAMATSRGFLRQAALGLCLLVLGLLAGMFGGGLVMGFICLAGLLLGAALCLPLILSTVIQGLQSRGRGPIAVWFWADTRQQLPGLSLALMALMLALAANLGVSTMVGSFRVTFTGWLDQRLAAELYVTGRTEAEAAQIAAYLTPRTEALLPIVSAETTLGGTPGAVFGVVDHATYRDHWPLIDGTADAWNRLAEGSGMIVNEQLARRQNLWTGAIIDMDGAPFDVVAVYSDYGNPRGEAIIGHDRFTALFPEAERLRFAVRTDQPEALLADVRQALDLPDGLMVDQERIKAFSLRVFERTFLVTGALNVLTLGVAGFALWASMTTLAGLRLPQLAPLWALGLTRAELARLELLRALGLALFTLMVALPVGLVLAWVLLAIVNVEAFGWRLPMTVFPVDWVWLGLWALIAAAVSAALPALRLARLSPARLLSVFAHAR